MPERLYQGHSHHIMHGHNHNPLYARTPVHISGVDGVPSKIVFCSAVGDDDDDDDDVYKNNFISMFHTSSSNHTLAYNHRHENEYILGSVASK